MKSRTKRFRKSLWKSPAPFFSLDTFLALFRHCAKTGTWPIFARGEAVKKPTCRRAALRGRPECPHHCFGQRATGLGSPQFFAPSEGSQEILFQGGVIGSGSQSYARSRHLLECGSLLPPWVGASVATKALRVKAQASLRTPRASPECAIAFCVVDSRF